MRRFYFLLLALAALGGLIGWWIYRTSPPSGPVDFAPIASSDQQAIPAAPTKSAEERAAAWMQSVKEILATYEREKQAGAARDALLALTVERADQALHLQLVMAFTALAEEKGDGATKYTQAVQAFKKRFP